MRYYQIDGLNWLIQLYDHGINGVLADEMVKKKKKEKKIAFQQFSFQKNKTRVWEKLCKQFLCWVI